MSRAIKLFKGEAQQNLVKKIPYPNDFNQLIKSVRDYAPIVEQNKKYELIEEEANREIEDQEDFELMTRYFIDKIDKKPIKIRINIVDKTEEEIKNDAIKNLKEIKKEETKYTIPETVKDNFRKKLNELGEQFLAEIEQNLNNKNSTKENNGQDRKIYCSKCKEEIKE